MWVRLARVAWGSVLLAAPGRVLAVVGDDDPLLEPVVRVLGARHLLQALLLGGHSRTAHRLGAAIDAGHVASLVVAAAFSPGRRRVALTGALSGSVWALLSLRATRASR